MRLADEVGNLLELTDGEYLFCGLQVRVGNEVAVLGEKVIDKNFLLVFGEHSQSFTGGLQMGDKLFAFNVQRFFSFTQASVYLYDVLGNLAELIVRKGGLYIGFHRFVLVGALGKFAQVIDCGTQFGCKLVEDEYQQ